MAHALDGAKLKVVRAQEHLDALKTQISAYLDAKPNRIEAEPHNDLRFFLSPMPPNQNILFVLDAWSPKDPFFDLMNGDTEIPKELAVALNSSMADARSWTFRPVVTGPPPLGLSHLVADCLSNIRPPLDYIAWEIAKRFFNEPITEKTKKFVSFPLADHPNDGTLVSKLNAFADRGVPTAVIDEIKAVQPYEAGQEPLRWLRDAVNEDKHRDPVLTISFLSETAFIRKDPDSTHTIIGSNFDGSAFHTSDPRFANEVEMHCQATVHVAIDDPLMPRGPIDRTLEQIIKTVADVIPRFEGFLS